MSQGEMLYLAMVVVSFVGFGLTLAVFSAQQAKMGPDMIPPKAGNGHH